MDFSLFFFEKADQLVVLLDGFERLDVDRLPGGACSVDNAGDATLLLGLDGDDEAVAADGDEVVLRLVVGGEPAQGGAQALFDDALLALLFVSDAGKLGACVVGERAVGEKLALDRLGERTEVLGERRGELLQAGDCGCSGGRRVTQQGLPGGDVIGESGDGLEFVGLEGGVGDLGFGGELRGRRAGSSRRC